MYDEASLSCPPLPTSLSSHKSQERKHARASPTSQEHLMLAYLLLLFRKISLFSSQLILTHFDLCQKYIA